MKSVQITHHTECPVLKILSVVYENQIKYLDLSLEKKTPGNPILWQKKS